MGGAGSSEKTDNIDGSKRDHRQKNNSVERGRKSRKYNKKKDLSITILHCVTEQQQIEWGWEPLMIYIGVGAQYGQSSHKQVD